MLKAMGAQVEWRSLTLGDYVVGPETVIERKTVAGLHITIRQGRFWHQMAKIRAAGRWPYLVIEGQSIFRGPMRANAVRGLCLAVSDLGVAIIRTESPSDTSAWLLALASRRCNGAIRDRPIYAQRPKSPRVSPPEAALSAAPNVSVITARRILNRFGSLHQVGEASIDDLLSVPGVGIKRATAIAALIHDPWNATNAH
ncbi:MAG: Hef nuclease [Actinomycetia bacterium]|nr:Hef nuclease [Actinomycetes bacterium]